jgi:hypothetical protein
MLSDPDNPFDLETVFRQQPRHRGLIEEKIVLGNKLPPLCFHELKRKRLDVGSFQNKQAAGLDSFRHGSNESFWRIHVFDYMKARNDIEAVPRQRFDHIAVYWSDFFRVVRQAGVRLDPGYVEPLAGHTQKIPAGASHFKELSRSSELFYQIEPPLGIQNSQPMLFLKPEISNVEVCSLDATGNLGRISASGTKSELGSSPSDVSKSAIPTLHQRSIKLGRFQDGKGIIGPA